MAEQVSNVLFFTCLLSMRFTETLLRRHKFVVKGGLWSSMRLTPSPLSHPSTQPLSIVLYLAILTPSLTFELCPLPVTPPLSVTSPPLSASLRFGSFPLVQPPPQDPHSMQSPLIAHSSIPKPTWLLSKRTACATLVYVLKLVSIALTN